MELMDLLQWPAMLASLAAAWLVASASESRRAVGFWVQQCAVGHLAHSQGGLGPGRAAGRVGRDQHPRAQKNDVKTDD